MNDISYTQFLPSVLINRTFFLSFLSLSTVRESMRASGVTKANLHKYETACGVQLIEGISDVVRSDEHLRLMQKARSYALKYNAIIKIHCQP